MKKQFAFVLPMLFFLSGAAFAQQPFTLVSSEKRTVKETDLVSLQTGQSSGRKDAASLAFTDKEIYLVVTTGPEDDMLSYRVQGIRNPTLTVPKGASIRILFLNVDGDMTHDMRFGDVKGEFTPRPDISGTVGTNKLGSAMEGVFQAEEIVIRASEEGAFKYFCSVGSHAKGGMWGSIVVVPGMQHGHSPGDQKMDMPAATPTPHHHMSDMSESPAAAPTPQRQMPDMPGMAGAIPMQMPAVTNIGDPMSRESSGTAWAPDSAPIYGHMKMTSGGGMWMFMGTAFIRYTQIGSSRDVSVAWKGSRAKADAPSMFMAMYSHPIGKSSQFGFRGMLSLDPLIEQGFGYPLLYQSGEEYRGRPLHDRQHPHDLISELAVTLSHKFTNGHSLYLYAGLPGEPALGPPMYLHRLSGMNNPDAPIGHHWEDSTHITYGVVTAGYSFGKAKIEASAFKGREPDANRWNFDRPRLDSFSARFSYNPTDRWALQLSHGYLKDPEPAEPEVHILRRTTASAVYNRVFNNGRNWAGTLLWGQNYANGQRSNAVLAETNYDFGKNSAFGRLEGVQKSGHDLVLAPELHDDLFWIGSLSAGYVRDLVQGKGLDVGVGGMLTLNGNPSSLAPYYGGTGHAGWQVFMRFRPSKN